MVGIAILLFFLDLQGGKSFGAFPQEGIFDGLVSNAPLNLHLCLNFLILLALLFNTLLVARGRCFYAVAVGPIASRAEY